MRKQHRAPWEAQGFVNLGTNTASLGKIAFTDMVGGANVAGISTITSGTTVVSVSAPGVNSGDVIGTFPIQFTLVQNSANFCMVTVARSVRADAFEIVTAGSVAPAADMNVGWMIIQR